MAVSIKRITIPVSEDQHQPVKASLKILEGDLDLLITDIDNQFANTPTLHGPETLTNKTLTSPTINSGTISLATINTPTVTNATINTSLLVSPIINGNAVASGEAHFNNSTAVPAGGSTSVGIKATSVTNLGIFFGSGTPTMLAAKGSLYIRTDGNASSNRFYINTDGSNGWTAGSTAS